MSTVDIAIVGGGLAGAALAYALAEKNFRIALIDASTNKEDARLIALNYHSISFLKKLNIWPQLADDAAEIQQVHISHKGHFGSAHLVAEKFRLPYLGQVVPAKNINNVLQEKIQHPLIEISQPAVVTDLIQDENEAKLTIKNDSNNAKEITAHWVIAADGTQSTIRNLLNIPIETIDYQQSALVTMTQLKRGHKNIAYERFQEQGAIALLPLKNDQAATIWTSHKDKITSLMNLSDNDFLQILQQQFGYRLGRFLGITHRATYPLNYLRAKQQQVKRVLLIGNAAHTMHPIAAQGLNLALHEISEISEQLTDLNQLINFKFNQEKIKMSTEFSHRLSSLFNLDFFPVNTVRSLSLIGLDLFPSIKRKFILSLIQ